LLLVKNTYPEFTIKKMNATIGLEKKKPFERLSQKIGERKTYETICITLNPQSSFGAQFFRHGRHCAKQDREKGVWGHMVQLGRQTLGAMGRLMRT